MSRLSKLLGQEQEVEINGEKFMLKPLTMKNLPLLMEMNSSDQIKQAEAMKKVITLTLKESVPDATDEEIENIDIGKFSELVEAIVKVNGLDNKNARIKDTES